MSLLARSKTTAKTKPSTLPARFRTAPLTLFWDRFMNQFIRISGAGVIAVVFGIFIFILCQVIPLFQGASVQEFGQYSFPPKNYEVIGADEWTELPFAVTTTGEIDFIDIPREGRLISKQIKLNEEEAITAIRYVPELQCVLAGTDAGRFIITKIDYKPVFSQGARSIEVSVSEEAAYSIGTSAARIKDSDYGDRDSEKLIAAIQEEAGQLSVQALRLKQRQTLFGAGEIKIDERYDLSDRISGVPQKVLVSANADTILVSTEKGDIYFFYSDDGDIELRQVFTPFDDRPVKSIISMDYTLGDVSLVLSNAEGVVRRFSLFVPPGSGTRLFEFINEFIPIEGGATFYAPSLRNKAFLLGNQQDVYLNYATTGAVRWHKKVPYKISKGVIGGKYNSLLLLDEANTLHVYDLKDEHPQAGWRAFLSKIWYEGYSEPGYVWQSTGGTDDFEPKLSLVPLIIGTLKGTFYAMLFALPIALLAAFYTSQFLADKSRAFIKPTMEIMASLPSVVLGFLAALWLAPLIEQRVPSLLACVFTVPLSAMLVGELWTRVPLRYRGWIRHGYEWILLLPILWFSCWFGWHLGPVLENLFFYVSDPVTGVKTADFRLWWPQVTGSPFEQRNSLVVGFMMGFAVIPIIFTIAEDALSNVPKKLKSAALALGASRWQTAFQVVLPTAMGGIFSSIMIGLGRAVGETMIVVMATGNTPVMDFNMFSGMRTLSANVAVELPEAPYLGTLYRTLFLGGLVLFMLTFCVNTVAEIVRQRIRQKYKNM